MFQLFVAHIRDACPLGAIEGTLGGIQGTIGEIEGTLCGGIAGLLQLTSSLDCFSICRYARQS
ncbi:hypothetical protein EEB19_19705 [Gordonia sp. OPL2]|nr:hypothetical protein EEB19_19705 [Gordonia sp. OPL2]